jgi:hypothetical protein
MYPVVGQQHEILTGRIGQLLGVRVAQLACFDRRRHGESPRTHEIGEQDIDILVQVKLDEELTQDLATRGSMRSSGMRFLSM